jgi:glutathione S-transferase
MGSGRYSQELPYNDWLRFNNAQRAHYNFVEGISTSITLLIIGGFYYPVISASFGLAMIIGRMIYSVGYTLRGPAGRTIGVVLIDISLLATLVLSIMTGVKMIMGQPLV